MRNTARCATGHDRPESSVTIAGIPSEASRARSYPSLGELLSFGRDVCGVYNPAAVVAQVQGGMREALHLAHAEPAVPNALRLAVESAWKEGELGY